MIALGELFFVAFPHKQLAYYLLNGSTIFKQDSAMMKPALQYLVLRSLGAPAVLLSLAMQGVFRGLKDTKTPLYATGIIVLFFFDSKMYILGKLNSKRKLPLHSYRV